MTTPAKREEAAAKDERSHQALSRLLRVAGRIVVLAAVVAVVVPALWVFAPELVTDSRCTEGMTVRILVTSLILSSVGGLLMGAITENAWWLLPVFAAGGVVALWLLIGAAMGPLMH